MTLGFILVVVGVILIIISAFWSPARPRSVSFWNLGWGLVLAGLLVFGDTKLSTA